jgi:mono/diheme cytochrome c family protein
MKKMPDGFRRLAIVLAAILLLTPSANLMAGITSEGKSRAVIADNSSSTSASEGSNARVAPVTPQARAEAADIFDSRCVACHGPEGHGDGPAASNLNPKPRDFHSRKWQKSIDDATIARAIVYGGSSVGVSGEMAANPDLEDEPGVVAALVEHVRGLGK